MRFAKGFFAILEEHHAEAAGNQIETLIGKWQLMRVRLLGHEVRESALLSPFPGDFEKIAAEVEGDDMAFGADTSGQADGRLPRAARQIQNLHARFWPGIFD